MKSAISRSSGPANCTRGRPTYGILGLFHLLPPALAWLWRLVSPRGHANPSIVDQGARTLTEFFHAQVRDFLHPDLAPLGRDIIECCLSDASVSEYARFIPTLEA